MEVANGKRLVILDGAAGTIFHHKKLKNTLLIEVILGDFDSVEPEILKTYERERKIKILPRQAQNYTDLEKGIQYCDDQKATSIQILGALGSTRMDHTFANLSFLKQYYSVDRPIQIITDDEVIEYVKDRKFRFTAAEGKAVGIFGFPQAKVKSTGLTWDLTGQSLELGGFHSSSNYVKTPQVTLEVEGEALITYPR